MTPRGVTWLGLAANSALSAAKILAGHFCLSQAILADGLHSASDLITDIAVLAGLRTASKPADGGHHYGHRRVSTLVGMFIGTVLLLSAAWIMYKAIGRLRHPAGDVRGALPFVLAVVSIPIKELLFRITRYAGKRASNVSLLANAWHHRSDAVSSVAAAAGLGGVLFGGPGWGFLDEVTAIVLGAFLAVIAGRIIFSAAEELIDRAPAAATLADIAQALQQTRGVQGYHAFRARQVGGKVAMDVHIQVDPALTVREGHKIASAVRRRIMQTDPSVLEVIVHVEPADHSAG